MERRRILLIFVVGLTLLALVAAAYVINRPAPSSPSTIRYRVLLSSTGDSPAEVCLPALVDGNVDILPFNDEFEVVNGTGSFEVVDGAHGPCIAVTFTRNVELELVVSSETHRGLYPRTVYLSMASQDMVESRRYYEFWFNGDADFWIYGGPIPGGDNSSSPFPIEVVLYYETRSFDRQLGFYMDTTIGGGWQVSTAILSAAGP